MRKKKESEAPERAEKPKKEQKIVYIDDGSTVADMSGTFKKGREPKQRSTWREKMRTYFAVVRKLLPYMFCTLIAFVLVFIILLAATNRL